MVKKPAVIKKAVPRRRRNLTRKDWVAAAREILIVSGIDDVKVDIIARRMRVTRGSFYFHFKHREDLLQALLEDWEVRNEVEIASLKSRWAETEPDMSELVRIWLGEDVQVPAFDMAIRVWARKTHDVAGVVRRIDAAWIALLNRLFLRMGYETTESLIRARVVYLHQIGYYALGIEESLQERIRLMPTYYKVLTSRTADKSLAQALAALTPATRARTQK